MQDLKKQSPRLCNCWPPWQVLALVGRHLDPKTLVLASCVSKPWLISMSSDHLWEPMCSLHFPAVSTLRSADPSVSFRRLYSLGRISADRRLGRNRKPLLSLNNLVFTVTAHVTAGANTKGGGHVLAVATAARRLQPTTDGMFRFDLDINDETWLPHRSLKKIRVTWNVSLEGYGAVFTMINCKEIAGLRPRIGGWMWEELPSTTCCFSGAEGSGMVAEGRLGMKEIDGKVKVEKVGVGMLNVLNWRYVGMEDGIRYLEHFLVAKS